MKGDSITWKSFTKRKYKDLSKVDQFRRSLFNDAISGANYIKWNDLMTENNDF